MNNQFKVSLLLILFSSLAYSQEVKAKTKPLTLFQIQDILGIKGDNIEIELDSPARLVFITNGKVSRRSEFKKNHIVHYYYQVIANLSKKHPESLKYRFGHTSIYEKGGGVVNTGGLEGSTFLLPKNHFITEPYTMSNEKFKFNQRILILEVKDENDTVVFKLEIEITQS